VRAEIGSQDTGRSRSAAKIENPRHADAGEVLNFRLLFRVQKNQHPKRRAYVLRIPPGSASRPIPKIVYFLHAPHRWWSHSIVRIMAEEFYNFPRRILAVLKKPSLARELALPSEPEGGKKHPFDVHNWLCDCISCIRSLQSRNRWMGSLEFELCAEAFAKGTGWNERNSCTQRRDAEPNSLRDSQFRL
jgi:hypothetical protein